MDWTNLIPWSISLISLIIVIISFARSGRKERKQEFVDEEAKIDDIKESLLKANMKLDQVCATTNETRSDIKSMNEYLNAVEKRVSIIENTIDTIWVRIDELKTRVNNS